MFAGQFKDAGPSRGDNFNMTHPLFQLVAKLNNFRRLYPALQTGVQSNLWSNGNGPGLFAYTRRLGQQEVLVVFNTAETNQTLPPCPTGYPAGTKLDNLLDEKETLTVRRRRTPPIVVPGTSANIFVAESELRPLDPVVTAISPAHDARKSRRPRRLSFTSASRWTPPASRRAFDGATDAGHVLLDAAGSTMTFAPKAPGFQPHTLITVRVGDTARAADSRSTFYAGFESRFRCGGVDSAADETPRNLKSAGNRALEVKHLHAE